MGSVRDGGRSGARILPLSWVVAGVAGVVVAAIRADGGSASGLASSSGPIWVSTGISVTVRS